MALCLCFGTRPDPVNPAPPKPDYFGFASGGVALRSSMRSRPGQPRRLAELRTDLGIVDRGHTPHRRVLIHEAHTPTPPWTSESCSRPRCPAARHDRLPALTILSTAIVIPQFLQVVRGFRAIEVGDTLVWIAAPQFILCLMAGYILRRVDARFVASLGFMFICAACLMVAHTITRSGARISFCPRHCYKPSDRASPCRELSFRGVAPAAPGCADFCLRAPGLAPDGRRAGHRVHHDDPAQARPGRFPTSSDSTCKW